MLGGKVICMCQFLVYVLSASHVEEFACGQPVTTAGMGRLACVDTHPRTGGSSPQNGLSGGLRHASNPTQLCFHSGSEVVGDVSLVTVVDVSPPRFTRVRPLVWVNHTDMRH